MRTREIVAAARLDLGEIRRSRWLLFAGAVYAVLAAGLVFAATRESGVLGYTGTGRVLLSFTHALLVVLPLLAFTATTQVVNRARDDGSMELLFSNPLSRDSYLVAITLTRFLGLALPFVAVLLVVALVGVTFFRESMPWAMLGRTAVVGAALLWTFVGIGIAVSTRTRHQAKAVIVGLVLWALVVAFLDLAIVGVLLALRVEPHTVLALAAANPVQAARLALLSGLEPDLGTLGPVGFYAAHHLGPPALFAAGVAWPLAVGTGAWLWALRVFRRGDLV